MDALRNAGRGQLSSFAGGANIAQDADQWEVAPYTEADLEHQTKPPPGFPAALAATISSDADNYIAGINQLHQRGEARPDQDAGRVRRARPPAGAGAVEAHRPRRGRLARRRDLRQGRRQRDRVDRGQARARRSLQEKQRAKGVFKDFRAAEDPEAPTTVLGKKRFTYQAPPKKLAEGLAARSTAAAR